MSVEEKRRRFNKLKDKFDLEIEKRGTIHD